MGLAWPQPVRWADLHSDALSSKNPETMSPILKTRVGISMQRGDVYAFTRTYT